MICATDLLDGVFWNPMFREALAEPRKTIVCPRKLLRESTLLAVKSVSGGFRPILSQGRLLPGSPPGIEVRQKAEPARIAPHEKGLMELLAVPALQVLRDFASTAGHVLGSDNPVLFEWAALAHSMGITRYAMHTPFLEREFRRQTRRANVTVSRDLSGTREIWPDLYDLYAECTLPRSLRKRKRLARAFVEFLLDRLMRALHYYGHISERDIADAVRPFYAAEHALTWSLRRLRWIRKEELGIHTLDQVGLLIGVSEALSGDALDKIANPLRRPKWPREGRYIRRAMRKEYEGEELLDATPRRISPPPRIPPQRIPNPPLAGLTVTQTEAVKAYAEACRMGYGRWSKSLSLRRYLGKRYWSVIKSLSRARDRSPALDQWFRLLRGQRPDSGPAIKRKM